MRSALHQPSMRTLLALLATAALSGCADGGDGGVANAPEDADADRSAAPERDDADRAPRIDGTVWYLDPEDDNARGFEREARGIHRIDFGRDEPAVLSVAGVCAYASAPYALEGDVLVVGELEARSKDLRRSCAPLPTDEARLLGMTERLFGSLDDARFRVERDARRLVLVPLPPASGESGGDPDEVGAASGTSLVFRSVRPERDVAAPVDELIDRRWTLESRRSADGRSNAIAPGDRVANGLAFVESTDRFLFLRGLCRSDSLSFELEGGRIVTGAYRRGESWCEEHDAPAPERTTYLFDIFAAEGEFAYRVDDGLLTLERENGEAFVFLEGNRRSFTQTEWALRSLRADDGGYRPQRGAHRLRFGEDGRFEGDAPCGPLSGRYSLESGVLRLDADAEPGGGARPRCAASVAIGGEGSPDTIETLLLGEPLLVRIDEATLALESGRNETLIFRGDTVDPDVVRVPVTELARGAVAASGEAPNPDGTFRANDLEEAIIRDRAGLEALWRRLPPDPSRSAAPPAVDFPRQLVVAAFVDPDGPPVRDISVRDAFEYRGAKLWVTLYTDEWRSRGEEGCPPAPSDTAPWVVVVVDSRLALSNGRLWRSTVSPCTGL